MANITQEQFNQLLNEAPQGTTAESLTSALRGRGHILEFSQKPAGLLSFGERFKMSFGGEETIAELKAREQEAGLRGRLDVGDIADIAGGALPFAGGLVGGMAGLGGAAVGVGLGELSRQAIGQAFGTQEKFDIGRAVKEAGITYLGGKVLQGVGGYIANRFPKLLGTLTGQNVDEITAVLSDPKAADIGINQGDDALRAIVDSGAKESKRIALDFIKGQREGVNKLASQYNKTLATGKEILVSFRNAIRQEGIVIKNGNLKFPAEFLADPRNNARKISNVYRMLIGKKSFTLTELNSAKQAVGEATGFVERGVSSKVPILGRFYHELDDMIRTRLPQDVSKQYSQLNEVFSKNIKFYNELVKVFNSSDPFTKLAGVLRENADNLRRLLQFYEEKTGKSIISQIAGRAIAGEREAAFGLLNPREWIDIVISPKVQAKGISALGKAERFVEPIKEAGKRVLPSLLPDIFR